MKTKMLISCWWVFILGPGLAIGQTNAEINAAIQFNFSTPGAHSLALGGAYVALAEDASAAYTNPAGLVGIASSELTIEARNWSYDHEFTDRGRLQGNVTGRGVDALEGLVEGRASNEVTGLSFFSYVYPGKKWSFGIYRHELANFQARFETQGAFVTGNRRLFPTRNEMDLDIINHGVSAAYALTERASIGFGISLYDFTMDSVTVRYDLPPSRSFAEPNYAPDNELTYQLQVGEDSKWSASFGLLWRISESWRVGAAYRHGPRFEFGATNKTLPMTGGPSSRRAPDSPEGNAASFNVPNVLALGIAFQPSDRFRATLDYDRVSYADLTDGFTDIFDLASLGEDPELDRFGVEDAEEFHLGFEFFLLRFRFPVALRFGAWHDPDHKLRFQGESLDFRALFQPGKDETHYSAGVGISTKRYQFDTAFEYSDRVKTLSFSTGFRF